jgi:hypothetical protein
MSAERKAWEDGVYADEIARALDWPRDLAAKENPPDGEE